VTQQNGGRNVQQGDGKNRASSVRCCTYGGGLVSGVCWFWQACPVISPTSEIKQIAIDTGNAAASLKGTTETIKTNANDGMKATPPAAQPIVNPFFIRILGAVGGQDQIVKQLEETKARAEAAEKTSGKFEADFQKEHDARLKAEDNVTKELRQKYLGYSGILFFIALICGGISIYAHGNKIAMYGGILCGIGSAVCITIVQVAPLIPWIIGGLALVTVGLLIYSYVKKNGEIKLFHTATKELVETMEAAKPKMTAAGRAKVFGDGPGKGEAFAIQSKETEAIVSEMREDIEKAPPLPGTVAADWNGDGVIDERDIPPFAIEPPTLPSELVSPNRPLGRAKVLS
jgi:hypothetical protein